MKNKIQNSEYKDITIDELAGMTARGFMSMGKMFDDKLVGMEKRFDDKFDRLEQKIDNLATAVEDGFNKVNGRIDGIYLNYVTIREHKMLSDRVKKLEQ
jgi:hypothetical protein